MRTICGLAGLAAAGFLAASAYGLGVPTVSTPTLTAPSLSTPSVSVPSVPLPSLPKPTAPAPTAPAPTAPAPTVRAPTAPAPTVRAPTVSVYTPKPPPAPVPAPTVSTPSAPAPAPVQAPSTPTTSGSAPSPSKSASPTKAAPAPPAGAPVSAPTARPPARSYGVAGSSHTARHRSAHSSLPGLRRVIARFTLARPARVRISIQQLAPVCRRLRSYLVRLPRGMHAFRFPITRVTEIGTYRVTATLRSHKLFSVHARRLRKRVRLGGTANVCPDLTTRTAYSLATPSTLAGAGSLGNGKGQLHLKGAHARRVAAPPANGPRERKRNPLIRAVSITDAPPSLQPLLYTLLAIAIILLALAAAPQHVLPAGRAAAIVATRRAYFAAAGIWLLIVVAIVTAFA